MERPNPEPCRDNDLGKFEIISRDGVARIGKFYTKHGVINTPTLLPVINPNIRTIEPRDMWNNFNIECLITNSYIIRNNEKLSKEALSKGVHSLLDFPGAIMTDSGTFQSYVYGEIDVKPAEIVEFQKNIGVDIGTMLDVFGKPTLNFDESKKVVEETILRSKTSINSAEGMMLNGPIQGGLFPELRLLSASKMSEFDFSIHPIGGIVPLMEQQKYSELVKIISSCRHIIPSSKPIHLFGCGHPHLFGLAVAMGVDLFDSAAYALFARDDRLIMPWGTEKLENINEWPTASHTFAELTPTQVKSLPKNERTKLLARFNLEISMSELARVREAVRRGKIWEYVERKSAEHPALELALKLLFEGDTELDFMKWVEHATKIQKKGGVLWSKKINSHPYVKAASNLISKHTMSPTKDAFGNKVNKSNWDIVVLHGIKGPWRMKCKELIFELMSRFEKIQIYLQTPIGIIPFYFEDLNPFAHVNGPNELWRFNKNDVSFQYNTLTPIHGLEGPHKAVEQLIQSGATLSDSKLNKETINTYLDKNSVIQKTSLFTKLEPHITEKWLSNATFIKGGTRRIRNIIDSSGTHILSPRLDNGGVSLTINGAKDLYEFSKKGTCKIPLIKIVEGAIPFVRKGRNVMHGFILSVTGTLRPGMPCLIIDESNNLLAHGISCCTNSETTELKKGIAVKIKTGIDEK
jgi:7-cyano-7-deazaguanine tRNA-ribosyltransferase